MGVIGTREGNALGDLQLIRARGRRHGAPDGGTAVCRRLTLWYALESGPLTPTGSDDAAGMLCTSAGQPMRRYWPEQVEVGGPGDPFHRSPPGRREYRSRRTGISQKRGGGRPKVERMWPDAVREALRATDISAGALIMPCRGVRFHASGRNTLATGQWVSAGYRAVRPSTLVSEAVVFPFPGRSLRKLRRIELPARTIRRLAARSD